MSVTQTSDCLEALQISRNEHGRVDIEYIERLTGKTFETVIKELGDSVYRNPVEATETDKYSGYETSEEYLSGYVVEKLETAKEAAKEYPDGGYERNVAALESVQPKPLKASEIFVQIGSSWLDREYYKEFLCELLAIGSWESRGLEIEYTRYDGAWRVMKTTNPMRNYRNVLTHTTYGTKRASAFRLFEDSLNNRDTTITDTIRDADGNERQVVNQAETIAAREKQNQIKERFRSWIFEDPNRREELEKKYNRLFNQVRLPRYDGSHLTFPGMNPAIELNKHQKDAVLRIVMTGNTLIPHKVGAGKTYTFCAAAMKLRQYGLAKKIMIAVPNHLVGEWASFFLNLYPNAKLLIAEKEDLEKNNRLRFVSQAAMGDWDAIIIAQSSFAKIGVSKERRRKKLEQEIYDIEASIEAIAERKELHIQVKNLERIKKSRKEKLKKLMAEETKDTLITFEELGVDYLFIDEAHYYKNLSVFTKMNNVAGISNAASSRASDLQLKGEYLNELHGKEKGLVFATGTPISNSMTEMFVMQKYMHPDKMRELGIEHFDCWASDFGETVSAMELVPSGRGYKMRTRFAKFKNLPELMNLYGMFADVLPEGTIKLNVPEAERIVVTLKPSETVLELSDKIVARAEKLQNTKVDPRIDNMLKITSDGKKLALDPRCLDPFATDEAGSKLNVCAENVFREWQESKSFKGAQLVFCDLSTPKKPFEAYEYGKDFDVYNDLKYKLVSKGIPKEEIAYIHDAKTDADKQELFHNVNTGKVRILIGSTEKCGAGTNVQERLIALHHLDTPYRPSDLQQREGRIVRQGNTNEKVRIYTYVTERTFDSYSYQILENKQRFISQISSGDVTSREAEDIDEATLSYAELKAITAANPEIKRKMEVDTEISRLRILESQYRKNLYELQDKVRQEYPQSIARTERLLKNVKADVERIKEKYVPEVFRINVSGKEYTERKEGGQALMSALQQTSENTPIAEYAGFTIRLNPKQPNELERRVTLQGTGEYILAIGESASGTLQRLDNFLKELPEREKTLGKELERLKQDLSAMEEEVKKPWEHKSRLAELVSEQTVLNSKLSLDKQESVIPTEVEDEEGDAEAMYIALPKELERATDREDWSNWTEITETEETEELKKTEETSIYINPQLQGKTEVTAVEFEKYFPHLKDGKKIYAEEYMDGWYIETTLGGEELKAEIEKAIQERQNQSVRVALLKWDYDLKNKYTLDSLKTSKLSEIEITGSKTPSDAAGLFAKLELYQSANKVLNADFSFIGELDGVADSYYQEYAELKDRLKDIPRSDVYEIALQLPKLVEEFTDKLNFDILKYYGWEREHVKSALIGHLPNELRDYRVMNVLPDYALSEEELSSSGYRDSELLPLGRAVAQQIFEDNVEIYLLDRDGQAQEAATSKEIKMHNGRYGVKRSDWHYFLDTPQGREYAYARLLVLNACLPTMSIHRDEVWSAEVLNRAEKEKTALENLFETGGTPSVQRLSELIPEAVDYYAEELWRDKLSGYGYTFESWKSGLTHLIPDTAEHAENPFLTLIEQSAAVMIERGPTFHEQKSGYSLLYSETFDQWYVMDDELLRDEYGWRLKLGDKATKTAILSHYPPEANFLHGFLNERGAREYYEEKVRENRILAGEKIVPPKKDREVDAETYTVNRECFEYGEYHFIPERLLTKAENELSEITKKLRTDLELGFHKLNVYGKNRYEYDYQDFYAAATDQNSDLFRCLETGKLYLPCENALQEYLESDTEENRTVEFYERLKTLDGETVAKIRENRKTLLQECVQKEFSEYFDTERKKSREEIFADSDKTRFYIELEHFLTDDEESPLEEAEYQALFGDGDHVLSLLYDYYTKTEEASIKNSIGIQSLIKNYNQKYHAEILSAEKNLTEESTKESAVAEESATKSEREYLSVYLRASEYAVEHDEVQAYRASKKENLDCLHDMEKAVSENVSEHWLQSGFEQDLIERYGFERLNYVLAALVRNSGNDGRYSRENREWAQVQPSMESAEERYLYTNTHPVYINGIVDRVRKAERASEKEEQTEVPVKDYKTETKDGYKVLSIEQDAAESYREEHYGKEEEKVQEKKSDWITVRVAKDALIRRYPNHSFLRMPSSNREYSQYTYNVYNNRIREGQQITDLKSESGELCYELKLKTDELILLKTRDGDECELTAEEFKALVNGTTSKDYVREKKEVVEDDGRKWLSVSLPKEALIKSYDRSTLFALPNTASKIRHVYYVPNGYVEEDTDYEDGRILLKFPEDFSVTAKNRDSDSKLTYGAEEFYELCKDTRAENYEFGREEVEQSNRGAETEKVTVTVPENARIGTYEKSTLLKMPSGEYEGCSYYLPNHMIEESDMGLKITLPQDFIVGVKNNKLNESYNLSAAAFQAQVSGKTEEAYKGLYMRPSETKTDKFSAREQALRKNVPEEMKKRPNWVMVRTRRNEEKGRLEKFLIDCHTGKFAKSDDETTWTDFETACAYAKENGGETLAYALDGKDGICCIDLDHCFRENNNFSDLAKEVFDKTDGTYVERSISGGGLHFFGKTSGMDLRAFSKDGDLEFYQKSHFISLTGDDYGSIELKSFDTQEMKELLERKCAKRTEWTGVGVGVEGLSVMTDREVVEKAIASKNGDVFKALYNGQDLLNNHSNSDMSLMCRLAFWCNGDKEQMLRIFATSGLYRKNKSPDYYECTAIKAIQNNTSRFQAPNAKSPSAMSRADGRGKA